MDNEFQVTGPYHYSGDLHPCFRIATPSRIVAKVFFVDENEDLGHREATEIAAALRKMHEQRPGYTQYTDFRP